MSFKQAGGQTAARRLTARFTGSGAWRFWAASSRQVRENGSGYACRVSRGFTLGRGFESRRLQTSLSFLAKSAHRSCEAAKVGLPLGASYVWQASPGVNF